ATRREPRCVPRRRLRLRQGSRNRWPSTTGGSAERLNKRPVAVSATRRLRAADGHEFDAYVAEPEPSSAARGGVVVVQEIFGVTAHIRRVADRFAAHGYRAIAPAMFDRIERGIELDYSEIER